MQEETLRVLLEDVRRHARTVDDVLERLRVLPFEDLGFAKIDHHRGIRCGSPEVIYGEGKTSDQILEIFERRQAQGGNVLATRVSADIARSLLSRFPTAEYHAIARTVSLRQSVAATADGQVTIVSAGTSDLPVAEEARVTAEIMGQRVQTCYDVGVAGIHRLFARLDDLRAARVIVVVAGMEGALASVVGGLVSCPVIGVPTSVGYGSSFGGLAPLLTMLNSCAAGVAVVNIDNGFAAGYLAALINRAGHDISSDKDASPIAPRKDESTP